MQNTRALEHRLSVLEAEKPLPSDIEMQGGDPSPEKESKPKKETEKPKDEDCDCKDK